MRRCPWNKENIKDEDKSKEDEIDKSPIHEVKERTSLNEKEKVPIQCEMPPSVLGFLDPSIFTNNMTKLKILNATEAIILPGYKIIYKCSKGWVIDSFTNRRSFALKCNNDGKYDVPVSWPRCKEATHCVGPVARPAPGDQVYLPVPRRDAPVNTGRVGNGIFRKTIYSRV